MMSIVPDVVLSSGHKMPLIGFGTVAYPIAASDSIKTAIVNGMKHGYRHFDTAPVYQTEQLLGEAIAEALQLGLIKSRDELFITSKLWCSDAHHDRVLPALQNTLKTLQLDYLDLYLVHWPISSKPGKYEFPIPKEELVPQNVESVWAAMEECQALGLTKSIGVSNFSSKKLEQLLSTAKIPPEVTLNSGHRMPLVGMGTASYPFAGSEVVKSAILSAIKLGYRHFDTATLYKTEQIIGEAIAESLKLGLIKSREELFITTKLWVNDGHKDFILPALQRSLKNLQLDYIDLYLIHWPVSIPPGEVRFPGPNEKVLPIDYTSVWEAMEECQKLGLTKSIGVSNFTCKKLDLILASAKIPPAVNQVEVNPLWRQEKLIKFCKDKGIVVTAYSPLGNAGSDSQGNNKVIECELLKEIAEATGKTHAQVCIKWVFEQGVGIIVKSFNEVRLKENIDIVDWALSGEHSMKIGQLPQSKGYLGDIFVRADGPFKSLEELWDGEI